MTKKKRGMQPIEPIIGKREVVNVSIDAATRETLLKKGFNNLSAGIRILAREERERNNEK